MSSTKADTTRSASTNTVAGWPLRTTACGAPSTFFATCSKKRERAEGADHRSHRGPDPAAAVGPDHDVLRQHGQEAREVTRGARRQEAVGELAAVFQVSVEALPPLFDVPAGPGAELAARGRAAAERTSDLLERIAEDVVEEIRRTLERAQLLEQHEERQRQAVGVLDRGDVVVDHGLGQPGAGVRLAPRPGRVDLVEAEPRHDGDQVGPHRLDRLLAASQPPDARLLHDVLRVRRAPEHAVRDAEEQRAPLLEGRRLGVEITQWLRDGRHSATPRRAWGPRRTPRTPGCAGPIRR